MAATSYPLTAADWADCGAADDCAVQLRGAPALVTTGASKPASNAEGIELSRYLGGDRTISFQKAGLKVWGKAIGPNSTIVVER